MDNSRSKQLAFSCERGERNHEIEHFHQLTTQLDSLLRQVEVNIKQALSRLHMCLVANAERVFCLEQMQTKAFYSSRREKKTARKLLKMTSVKRRRGFVVAVQKKQICLPSSRPDKNTLLNILEQMGKQKDSNQNSKQKIDQRSQIYFRSSSEIWPLSQRRARAWNINRSQISNNKLSGRYLGCLPKSYPLQPKLHIIRNIGNGQYLILKKTDANRCVLKNKPQKCFNFPLQLNGTRQPKLTFRNIKNAEKPREYWDTKDKELNKWISKMTSQTYLSHARSQPQLSIRNIEINPEKNKPVLDETKGFSKYIVRTKSPAFVYPLSNCATTVSQIGSKSGNSETDEEGDVDLSVRGLGINGLLKINTQSFGTASAQSRSSFIPKLVVRKPVLSETERECLIALGKGMNMRILKSCPYMYLRSLTRSFNRGSNLRNEDNDDNEEDLLKIESLQVEENICSLKINEDKDKHFRLENTETNQYKLEMDPHDSYYLTNLLAQPKSPNIERTKEEINIFAERIDICNTVLQPNSGICNTNENKEDSVDSSLRNKEMKKSTSASKWQEQFKNKDSKEMKVTFANIKKHEENSKDLSKSEATEDSLDHTLLVCKVLNRHTTDDRGENVQVSGNKVVGRTSLTPSRRYVKYMPPKPTFSVPNIPNQDQREKSVSKITIVNKSLSHYMVRIPNIKTEENGNSSVPESKIMNREISQQKHRIPGIRNKKKQDASSTMTKIINKGKGIFRLKMPSIKKIKEHNNALASNTNTTKSSIPDIEISCEKGNDMLSEIKESKCISKTNNSYLTPTPPRHKLATSNSFKEKRRISFKKNKNERYQPNKEIPRAEEIQEKSHNTVSKGGQISHAHSETKVISPSIKRKERKHGNRILASKQSSKCGSQKTFKRTQSSKQKLGNVSVQKHGEKR